MLYFITSNQSKIDVAKWFLNPVGVEFEPKHLDLSEIQSHSIEDIAKHKANHAFSVIKKPLFVSDDGWSIPALNGFPGAYMKYINEWFSAEDFLKLMEDKEDRDIYLQQVICYQDESTTQTFSITHEGVVLYESQGDDAPGLTCVSLTGDGISIAKKKETRPSALEKNQLWTDFANWLKENKKI